MAQEKTFENKIKKYLENKGCWYVKYFANSYTKSGIPDILACVNGFFVAIEVKAENGRPSELQIYNRDKIREAGGVSVILYPSQFAEFKEFIENLLNKANYLNFTKQRGFDK